MHKPFCPITRADYQYFAFSNSPRPKDYTTGLAHRMEIEPLAAFAAKDATCG
jgi:hypothetical protein